MVGLHGFGNARRRPSTGLGGAWSWAFNSRITEQESQRERAEANIRHERAELDESGVADDELIREDERERFAGTSAVPKTDVDDEAAREGTGTYEERRSG